MQLSENSLEAIKRLCQIGKVKSLFAFGSVTREDYTNESDIDLVVDFDENDPLKYSELYFNLKDKLESLLLRKIDLLEERAIKNPFFKQELEQTKVKIYGH
ncbi:nucleotidyltransferase domain-containing protein [Marinilongibacter aquaticus]|uniref:nucleotidyltransferase family protein n=1 Tax=Marinilongibacter aquaticus TaxID=2975157 RepID=UPI0021BDC83B|nr:nucleotidyltransferase domain-containing protein [Marinilongibacter aquaticus]UBM59619.1 nucleotidyltransferase domain-containing protein [Marinilongibacter aquaticus]